MSGPINIIRTNSGNRDFVELVKLLDADLAIRDGDAHAFYDQFNKIDNIRYAVVAYADDKPAGCGAIKEYKQGTMEVKRMYVLPGNRKMGIASRILTGKMGEGIILFKMYPGNRKRTT